MNRKLVDLDSINALRNPNKIIFENTFERPQVGLNYIFRFDFDFYLC